MGLMNFWKPEPEPIKRLPVISQPAVTQKDVAAAPPPEVPATRKVDFLRDKLARNLIDLTRRSEELRSELVRLGLKSL